MLAILATIALYGAAIGFALPLIFAALWWAREVKRLCAELARQEEELKRFERDRQD